MTRKPWAPTPMKAMLTLSLGGTCPTPPNTRRGTIEKPIAAAAVCPKNSRRETAPSKKPRDRSRFFTLPPQPQLTDTDRFGCRSHFAMVYHSMGQPAYSKRTSGLYVRKPRGRAESPHKTTAKMRCGLAGDGFGHVLLWHGGAALEEAASGQQLGVEQGGARGAADEVVREQREFDVEQRAFADAADDGGHAVSGVNIATRLRPILFVEDDDGVSQSARKSGQLGVDFEVAQGFLNFVERGDFFQADGDAFEVAVDHGHSVAVGA